jgi:hypothetical protein
MFGKCGAFFLASFASLAVVYLVRAYAMPASPALLRAIILAPLFVIVYVAGIGVLDRDALRSWLNKARKIRAWKQA